MKKVLEFRKKRGFSDVISDTFQFFGIYFLPFYKTLAIIIGPAAVVGSILLAKFSVQFLDFRNFNQFPKQDIPGVLAGYLLFMISYLLTISCTFDFIKVTLRKKAEPATTEEVWKEVRKDVWKVLAIGFFFMIGIFVAVFAIAILGSLLGFASIILILPGIVFLIYALIKLTLSMAAGVLDDMRPGDAMVKSWYYVKGNFWPTFGISFVLAMVGGMVSTIIRIPVFIAQGISAYHGFNSEGVSGGWSTVLFISVTLGMLASLAGSSLVLIGHALQYYSIAEVREGKGLMDQINDLEIKSEDDHWGEEEY
jgi:hypothetical protein